MGAAFNVTTVLERETCGTCGIVFAAPDYFFKERKCNGGRFFCPNGHVWSYTEPEVERLKRELAGKEKALIFERHRRESAEREAKATRRRETKLKRRVGNGVCPCCRRQFQNLKRHMATKHPEVTGQAAAKALPAR